MRLTPQFESTLRRYVLGELEEGLRAELEELLVTDAEAFEALGVIEDELIEEYLEGTGSPAQRQSFEHQFLASPERSGRLRFARALRGRAARPERTLAAATPATHSPGLFPAARWQQVAIGLAATLVVSLTGNVWLAARQARPNLAMNSYISPPAPPEGAPLKERTAMPTIPVTAPPALKRSSAPMYTFVLAAGLLRSAGSLTPVAVPTDAVAVRLVLELPDDSYALYRAVLLNGEGDEVWAASRLRAEEELTKKVVVLVLPSGQLPRDDYQVKLSGTSMGAQPEGVGTYSFRVTTP